MKQIAQNYRSGELLMLEVPVPTCRPGGVLVRTEHSLVSTGTELMKINESKLSLIGKARARPDQVKKVLDSVSQQGLQATYRKVAGKLDSYTPLGYSLSGVVVEVGAGVSEFKVGDRVACGGNVHALHAEYNWVPTNLVVPVPDGVSSAHASFATVGSVSLHGFRQSEAKLGETACVVGLGLIGLLLVQILRAAGVTVVGVDPSAERRAVAEALGAASCWGTDDSAVAGGLEAVASLTGGMGIDHIFLTAGGDTNQPVELAAAMARDRARVTDIGKCQLDLPWKDYYEKELEVRFSRSYGPGRYDPVYEEGGVDYPIGYVRWTERRNMACFLDLVAEGRIDLAPITSAVVPFDDAVGAYDRLRTGKQRGVGVLFRYDADDRDIAGQRVDVPRAKRPRPAAGVARIGVIGAGNYATSMLLPHLAERSDATLVEVTTATSLSAVNAKRKFGFERAGTDYRGLLADDGIDAVLIATRHHSHAALVCEALRAGKAVFVEKPLAVHAAQLAAIVDTVAETGNDRIMVGFNRRFAPLLTALRQEWGPPRGPVHLRYAVNAGRLGHDSWYANRDEEGSRLVGEGCHFVDTASWWLGADPVEVFAAATSVDADDASVTLRYADGSVATIDYATNGDSRYPKETIEVFGGGRVAKLDNFGRTELWSGGRKQVKRSLGGVDKGQKAEVDAFVRAVATGAEMPVPLGSLLATTAATFAAVDSIATRTVQAVVVPAPSIMPSAMGAEEPA
ncbi:MAG TPA: bi-domain-containing oxidoreductase [Acidimicrobiales bacterium]|nr:bi-domain-containing oxidoreductase [Acidimicrobiales bacterium]